MSSEIQEKMCQLEKRENLVWGLLGVAELSRGGQVAFFLKKKIKKCKLYPGSLPRQQVYYLRDLE